MARRKAQAEIEVEDDSINEKLVKALKQVARAIQKYHFTWDELHYATINVQVEKLIPTVREVIQGREYEYKKLGEYVVAMHQLCGGLPVVRYQGENGSSVITRINAGVVLGYLRRGHSAEDVAKNFRIPIEPVREVGELAAIIDYDRRYA